MQSFTAYASVAVRSKRNQSDWGRVEMLMQLIFQFVIICAVVIVAYTALFFAASIGKGIGGIPAYLYAYIGGNLPLCALLTVVLQAAFVYLCCSTILGHISNHIVISFEILYMESMLLLFLCNSIKGYIYPRSKDLV